MIRQIVVKLNRVCNLRCTYCYYINDSTELPGLRMPWQVLNTFLDKYTDYCNRHSMMGNVVFHGGEPLLMGIHYVDKALSHYGFAGKALHGSIQTNGVLLDDAWIDLLRNHDVNIGVSLDGPREVHDKCRLSATGRGSYDQVLSAIRLLQGHGQRFGVLAVIDPKADGYEVFQHFVDLGIKSMDFLFPQSNRALQATHPIDVEGVTQYLLGAFLAWFNLDDPAVRVRLFRELIRRYFVEGLGYVPIGVAEWQSLAVLETDGSIAQLEELADVDRYDGGRRYNTGLNIMNCEMDEVDGYTDQFWRGLGCSELPTKCKSCEVNFICNGGNAGTRFDSKTGFDNPGLYCASLYAVSKLIERLLATQGHRSRVVPPRVIGAQIA